MRKNPTRLRGTNFCTSLSRFVLSFVRQPNGSECTQIVRNAPKRQCRVQWGGSGAFGVKIPTQLRGTNFCTSSSCFASSFVRQPNGPECTQIVRTHQNVSLGSHGVDRVCSLRKISMRLRGTNFCTSSARFTPSFVRQANCPGCTQMVRNTPKCQFRVKWGGSGALVMKNSDATSSHELLH